ncbi:isopropylmalate isomerase [Rhodobacteraceae bacterium WD3A24]|nr:isopropylmalate isomerase [Rhodobacteraceae bacterium WD3A24]
MDNLLDCALTRWQPGLGDPHPMGWITVAAYAAAALAAWRAGGRGIGMGRERVFWRLTAVLLAFLAVNKQLDLQSFMTATGRCVAQAEGWYDQRRAVQRTVILALMATAVAVWAGLVMLLRGALARVGLALTGLVFVFAFVLIRAVGFHHMDSLIDMEVMSVRMNWALELTGPALIILAALLTRRRGEAWGRDRLARRLHPD